MRLQRKAQRRRDMNRTISLAALTVLELTPPEMVKCAAMDAIIAEARGERSSPGEGDVDLIRLLRALPSDLPLSVEVPTLTLARTVDATKRARRALAATKRVLAKLDGTSPPADQPAGARNALLG